MDWGPRSRFRKAGWHSKEDVEVVEGVEARVEVIEDSFEDLVGSVYEEVGGDQIELFI